MFEEVGVDAFAVALVWREIPDGDDGADGADVAAGGAIDATHGIDVVGRGIRRGGDAADRAHAGAVAVFHTGAGAGDGVWHGPILRMAEGVRGAVRVF